MSKRQDKADDMDKYLKEAIPLSIVIASIKTALAKPTTEKIISLVEGKGKRLTRQDKADIEKAVIDIIANMKPSVFGIEQSWEPISEEETKANLSVLLSEQKRQRFASEVINEIRNRQMSIAEFLE